MICIVDYGAGNMHIVCVLEQAGARVRVTDEPAGLALPWQDKALPGTHRGRVETLLCAPVPRRAAGSDGRSHGNRR